MDYLQFKRVYHDDLLHFGIKRRSGRYPYGSGERPFQSETKREIIQGVKKAKSQGRMSNHKDASFWNSHEIANKMNYSLTNREGRESIHKLKSLSNSLDSKVKEFPDTFKREFNRAIKTQGFKKDVYEKLYKNSHGDSIDSKDFHRQLKRAIFDTALSEKHSPKTTANMKKLNLEISNYKHTLNKEVNRLLGEIGQEKIQKVKGELTYGDVLKRIFEYQSMSDWKNNVLEQYDHIMADEIYRIVSNNKGLSGSYSLIEYNKLYRK